MGKAPETCTYCDGHGNSSAGGLCGFCKDGVPLDTQEDWDNSWGKVGKGAKTNAEMANEAGIQESTFRNGS